MLEVVEVGVVLQNKAFRKKKCKKRKEKKGKKNLVESRFEYAPVPQ